MIVPDDLLGLYRQEPFTRNRESFTSFPREDLLDMQQYRDAAALVQDICGWGESHYERGWWQAKWQCAGGREMSWGSP